ncbi:hypothetical protein [Hymenobacter sp. YC55]|uniref:hypothetical protein n=1 Tax=Hymenobacter sp. YC55 TaxID=3034019 RepID=UPI0023F826AC|nr:hypothetical protein [Hymenobacter sp. YC55]MDF7815118.1 hypothetical protein [Hymenobacter sp. YC55]
MRTFLFLLLLALFLYSPWGPSWGKFAVNMSLIVYVSGKIFKHVPRGRHYE